MRGIAACAATAVLLGGCAAQRGFESSRDEYVKDWEFRLSRVVRQAGVRRDLNGIVTVRIVVLHDGKTESFGVLRTSGSEALDRYALQFVEKSLPMDPFPPVMRQRIEYFVLDVSWSFDGNGASFFPSMRQYDACRSGQEASCQRFPLAPASSK